MNKALLATAAALVLTLSSTGKATAQEARYGTEVCVNVSLAEEAKRLFPNATLHVLPDFTIRRMNGWRIVSGIVRADGRIHTDEAPSGESYGALEAERGGKWTAPRHPMGLSWPMFQGEEMVNLITTVQ